MHDQSLIKICFWALALLTAVFCLRQCEQGRLSDAFAISDAGIRGSQKMIETYNQNRFLYLHSYVLAYPGSQNQKRLNDFRHLQKAMDAYQLLLDQLRERLLTTAGLLPDQSLEMQSPEDARGIVKQVLLSGQFNAVQQIQDHTDKLRAAMIAVADSNSAFMSNMPLDFTVTAIGNYHLNGCSGNFRDLPLTGALAILSDLQTMANVALSQVLNFCEHKISGDKFCGFCGFMPMALPGSPYVQSLSRYEADIFLSGCLDDTKILKIQVNGSPLPVKGGMAHYEVRTNGTGRRAYVVEITGSTVRSRRKGVCRDTFRVTREFNFEVLTPHAQVHSDSMHYLYSGVENPLRIEGWDGYGGCGSLKIKASGARVKMNGGQYCTVIPNSLRPVILTIHHWDKFKFQVRPLPNPIAMLGGQSSGKAIPHESIATQTALYTRFPEDFDFEADCQIVDFHLTRFRPRGDPEEADNQGANFGTQAQRLLATVLPGDRLFFYDIRVKCPGDKEWRVIDALSLKVE